MAKRTLDDILADDELIPVPAEKSARNVGEARVLQSFEEISRFADVHGRPPKEASEDGTRVSLGERALAVRLRQFRADPDIPAMLAPADRHGLLAPPPGADASPQPGTLDDILGRDDGVLGGEHDDIFDLKFVGAKGDLVDFAAERRPCADFESYRPLFDACLADLAAGRRTARRFANESEISDGDFYVLNGVTAYVAEVRDDHVRYGRKDARLTVIFDNGTESDMLLRSLAAQLYRDKDGRRITDPEAGPLFVREVSDGDVRKGCVYIAVTQSKNPQLAGMRNLHKLGVTTGKPERRVRRAEFDPTFLMAPARLVKSYTIYNADPAKVESILHAFFAEVCLGIEVKDRFGSAVRPREWFVAPMEALEAAVERLFDGTIAECRYDALSQAVVRRL